MDGSVGDAVSASYSLAFSEQEQARYRRMAELASENESADWTAAGIVKGSSIADIGCGPGAVLRVIAQQVGRHGHAVGVDADRAAIDLALQEVADLPQAKAQVGTATSTGLDVGTFDVVMCRHVLAHNGGNEPAIVGHLAALAKSGGCVYLVDVDITLVRVTGEDPDLQDLRNRYAAFQQARGNDLSIGLRLGDLLNEAGLIVDRYALANASLVRLMPGYRPPAWAAREAMVAEGFATDEDVATWGEAFSRLDASARDQWVFVPNFVAIDRRQ
jgi:SAM-dependent methyltransferase